ncbi:energy transducer TonB [Lysobacter enzymogenes]|uniref:energy transducer TonB n=1 Tax=Lysobacter enzymogenes TaxID=69 RepID=UPI00384F9182
MRDALPAMPARTLALPLLCLCFAAAAAQEKPRAGEAGAEAPPVPHVVIAKPGAESPAPAIGFIPAPPERVEQMPQFPGGEASLKAYLKESLQYPAQALENQTRGLVVAEFVVDVDGTLKDVKIIRDIGGGCGAEAKRLVQNMPPWQPGRQGGEAVKVSYRLKIDFDPAQRQNDRKTRK